MKKGIILATLAILLGAGCPTRRTDEGADRRIALTLTIEQANSLADLPLACIQTEYPNKLGQTLGRKEDMGKPEELHTWEDPLARELEDNLQALTDLIADRFKTFLPKLVYPIRVGEHTNTAFGMAFAWDYASSLGKDSLKFVIEGRARDFYFTDGLSYGMGTKRI